MSVLSRAGLVSFGFLATLALAGCEAGGGGAPIYGAPAYDAQPAGPGSCPRLYDPVCGQQSGARRSFPNACEAQASGYRILHGGQCEAAGSGGYGGGYDGEGNPGGGYGGGGYDGGGYGGQGGAGQSPGGYRADGDRGGGYRGYDGSPPEGSGARPGGYGGAAGARPDGYGSGRDGGPVQAGGALPPPSGTPNAGGTPPGAASAPASGSTCPMVYQPVCGKRGSDQRTFPNSCQAGQAGFQVLYDSECRGPAVGGGSSGRGAQDGSQARGGPAAATGGQNQPANGSAPARSGTSDPGRNALAAQKPAGDQSCSRAYVPVCGSKGSAKKTFLNACLAASEGYTVSSSGRCK